MRNDSLALNPTMQRLLDHMTEDYRRQLYEFQDVDDRKYSADNKRKPISLARAISAMAQPDGMRGTPEDEFFSTVAKLSGAHYDRQRIVIPWGLFQRDLTVANAAQAGYLVATETQEAIDILRPVSVTARMGLRIETGLAGSQVIPKVTGKTTPYWLSTESAQVTASQPTLSQIALTPKTVGIVVNFSRQLSLQSNADAVIRRELLRTVGTAIDQAVLNGPGSSGQPLGLLHTPGVQTQSGTTLTDGILTMKKLSADANVDDERIRFLSTPAIRELLEKRPLTANASRYVWQNDMVADRRAYVSTDMPTATMIAGDWSNLYLGIWGPGFVVEVNPFDPTGFKSGQIKARILVSCDVAVLHPSGFVVASSIT